MNKEINETEIISLINRGVGQVEISSKLQIGIKPIHRISKRHGLYQILKQNNQRYKTHLSKERARLSHISLAENLNLKAGDKIRSLIIDDRFTTYDLKKYLNIPMKQCVQYLKYYNLYDECFKNGKEKKANIARINGKKAKEKLSGKEKKPITEFIRDRFELMKVNLIYKQKVYNELRKEFGFGEKKCKQLCERFGYPKNNPQTGNLNPMYAKSPSKKSGIGIKSHLYHDGNFIFCRSFLELKIYLYLIDNNIKFQMSKHRIKYKYNDIDRTYCPDIILEDNTVCEIKPSNLTKLEINKEKYKSMERYCSDFNLKCRYITELDFDIKKYNDLNHILNLINNKIILMDEKNLEKLKRNI